MSAADKKQPRKSDILPTLTLGDVTATSEITMIGIEPIPSDEAGVDTNLVRLVINDIHRAARSRTPEAMARVRAAYEAFHGMDETKGRRRVAVVEAIERALETWPGSGALPERALEVWPSDGVLPELARVLWAADEAFTRLPLGEVDACLAKAHQVAAAKKKGGPGNLSAIGVAAQLSARCGAFGDTSTVLAKSAFNEAMRPKRGRK